jgi:subtilisin-like proprotein convertase family protein
LVATLLASNGVYYPTGPQNYGAIPVGEKTSRQFSFIPAGSCAGSVTGVVSFADGPTDLGRGAWKFGLGQVQVTVVTQSFANAAFINIPDGTASIYPSTIPVSGITNPLAKVRVTLMGLSHTFPQDIGMILAGPGGQTVDFMDSCGTNISITGRTLTFDDSAASGLPETAIINSGTYRPTNFGPAGSYPSPAPPYPYGSMLTPLGDSPNGTWSLYIVDWSGGHTGSLSGGWKVEFLSSITNYLCCNALPPLGSTMATYSNNAVNLKWETLPGLHYQVQYRTNLTAGVWQNYGAAIPSAGVSLSTNDVLAGSPMRFYRIQVLP